VLVRRRGPDGDAVCATYGWDCGHGPLS
jgi:hypothetical protein